MASSQSLVTQPAFASQITNVPSPIGTSNITGGLQRGFMIWEKASTLYGSGGGPLGDGRDVINFLFNPSTVTSDYNVGNASLQAAMLYTVPGDSGNLLSPLLMQTVSWQLYFDRTFELLYGTPTSAINDPTTIGVQADVYQFMQFTGLLASLSSADETANATNSTVASSLGTQTATLGANTGGIMMMIPAYVYFGNAFNQANGRVGGQQFGAVNTQLAFYGFISEWTVEYTHWTTSMVPIRAAISVSFTMLPQPASNNADATATWKDAATLQKNYVSAPTFPTPGLGNTSGSGFPGIS
jgi:hypothetical protein